MLKHTLIRPLLYAFAALLLPLLLACGGDDDANNDAGSPAPRPTPTSAASGGGSSAAVTPAASDGICGPASSQIASVPRRNIRQFSAPPERVIDPAKTYVATMKTSKGTIVIQLAAADAPNTVNNFVFLSCNGFYDGLTFHRVVPGFVIQGGDPRGNGSGDAGYKFADEIKLLHDKAGVISMANSGVNTNGSQFFITIDPAPHLDSGQVGRFNAFGQVTEGQDVVRAIAVGDRILSVSIEEK